MDNAPYMPCKATAAAGTPLRFGKLASAAALSD